MYFRTLDPQSVFNMHRFYSSSLDETWTLSRVEIYKKFRRKGLATKLMNDLLDDAKSKNAQQIILTAQPSDSSIQREDLVAFYNKFGFELVRTHFLLGSFMILHL